RRRRGAAAGADRPGHGSPRRRHGPYQAGPRALPAALGLTGPVMTASRSTLTWSLIVIVGLLTLFPVLMLLVGSFSQGLTAFGSFTTAKYVAAYTDPHLAEVILNTAIFVIGSSIFAV